MKKIFHFKSIIFCIALLISCNDDAFLEEHPKDVFTIENTFATGKQVDEQLVTLYRAVAETYVDTWWLGHGSDLYDTEDYRCNWGKDGGSNYSRWGENSFNRQWNTLYKIAACANLALKGAGIVDWFSVEEKDYAIAQAKFFRGWAYLRLGELFGGVPIVEEFSETLKLDYERSSRAETYQFAIDNFKAALEGLPDYPKQSGRISKGAVNHFLAEAYLAKGITTNNSEGEYANSIATANEVITQHPLMTERFGVRADPNDTGTSNGAPNYRPDGDVFYDLFRIGNYDTPENTESVWVVKAADYETYYQYGKWTGFWFPSTRLWNITVSAAPVFHSILWDSAYLEEGTSNNPWSGNVNHNYYPGGFSGPYCGGWSTGTFAPTKYLAYKVWGENSDNEFWDDIRNSELNYSRIHLCIDQNHSLYGQPVTEDMLIFRGGDRGEMQIFPMSAKVFNREDLWGFGPEVLVYGEATIYGRDRYLVRSAETYFLRAEAYLRNGQADKAAEDINTLRQRANCAKLFTAGEVDIYTILDERVRELSYEEQRWPTLFRMGGEVLNNQLYNHAKYVADQPYYTGTIDWELLPIPEDAFIDLNTGAEIQQNEGWGEFTALTGDSP